jgi:glycosyltransferase involved in cell wall biosynthesis
MTGQERGALAVAVGPSLHVVLAVRSDAFAGVERYIATTANELIVRGHAVTVIGGHAVRMRAEVPHAVHVPASSTWAVVRALLRHARRADIVHTHMTAADLALMLTRPLLRGGCVSTLHFASPRGRGALGALLRPLIRRAFDRQIAISEFVRAAALEDAVVVLNGVPTCEAAHMQSQVVLVAQRLEPEKGTAVAVRAFATSRLAADGWELWIAGTGSERAQLESLVAAEHLAGVRFLGHRDDLLDVRSQAAMQLASAPAEPFGLSVAEAMATALPVVAADGGGHRETVGACRPDLLYRPDDVEAAAGLLRQLADAVELRREVGLDLQRWQRAHLSIDAHVDALLEVYRCAATDGRVGAGRAA